jgi:hypothetical protein
MSSMVAKHTSLRAILKIKEQPKVTWGEIPKVGWLGYVRNVSMREELQHNKECVA